MARARKHGPNREVMLVTTGQPYATPKALDDKLADRIARYVKMGDRPFVAAEMCEVPRRTYYEWMEKGTADILDALDTPYSRLAHKIEAAESFSEHQAQIAIRIHFGERVLQPLADGQTRIPGDWRAALAWLSRRRDGWQERKELSGPGGTALFPVTQLEELPEDELHERLDAGRARKTRSDQRAAPARRAVKAKVPAEPA